MPEYPNEESAHAHGGPWPTAEPKIERLSTAPSSYRNNAICPDCGSALSVHPCRETRWEKGERMEIGYWMAKCMNPECKRENEWINPLEFFSHA
jgi:hypothetical protein